MEDEQNELLRNEEVVNRPKKPYTTPQLTIHGTLEKITKGMGAGSKDGLAGSVLL